MSVEPSIWPPGDWPAPDRAIFVAGTPRSGSTALCRAMAATGLLGQPDEWCFDVFFHRTFPDEIATPERLLRHILEKGVSPNGVAAVKLFAAHWQPLAAQIRLSDWFPNVTWVWIRRRDLIAQAVSLHIALQSDAWTSAERARDVPLAYDHGVVEWAVADLIEQEASWAYFFAVNQITPVEVDYEEVHRPAAAIARIAAAAGVALPPDVPVEHELVVQRTARNADWKARFFAEVGERPFRRFGDLRAQEIEQRLVAERPALPRTLRSFGRWLRGDLKAI